MVELEGAGLKFDTLRHENEQIMILCIGEYLLRVVNAANQTMSVRGKIEEDKLIYVEQEAEIFAQVW